MQFRYLYFPSRFVLTEMHAMNAKDMVQTVKMTASLGLQLRFNTSNLFF